MSRIENQGRLFLELIEELRPHWRKDPGLPNRLTEWLTRHRAGSRDRRLYRELAYTAWRILPWIEDAAPETLIQRVATHAQSTKDTADFIDHFAAPDTDPTGPPAELLPDWLADQCPDALASDQRDALLDRAPLWIRIQTDDDPAVARELTELKIPFDASAVVPGAWKLPTESRVTQTNAFQQGLIEVQDIGSQALFHSLPGLLTGNWLDACAGAGGKTLQLAKILQGAGGTVTAHDIRPKPLRELQTRQKRAGLSNIIVSRSVAGKFDGVLVDAPCTGSGTWRRSPHLKWTTTEARIQRAQEKQLLLLAHFSQQVAVGGLLVYATCSLCRDENEAVVDTFRRDHPAFQPVSLQHPATRDQLTEGRMTLLPAELDSDAYFMAAMRRV